MCIDGMVKEEDVIRDSVAESGIGDVYFFFQAEDGIRDSVASRGLGDVYKRQTPEPAERSGSPRPAGRRLSGRTCGARTAASGRDSRRTCFLYSSDAADEGLGVYFGSCPYLNKKSQCILSAYILLK